MMWNKKDRYRIHAACQSITGEIRTQNEDNFYFSGTWMPAEHGDLNQKMTADVMHQWIAIFDGMGGEQEGHMASYIAAKTLDEEKDVKASDEKAMVALTETMNTRIMNYRKEKHLGSMGSTLIALKFDRNMIYGMAMGDSRLYRLRQGSLVQLSTDHVFTRPGSLRKQLVNYLGYDEKENMIPDLFAYNYVQGDKYLLCSDGITDMVKEKVIEKMLQLPVEEAVGGLIRETIRMGADDNATVIVAEVCIV